MTSIQHVLQRVVAHEVLTRQETSTVMQSITQGEYTDAQIAALIIALHLRGITADELLGFRDGLLESGLNIDLHCPEAIDIVGTGGDGKNTFNISTCASFVVAGAGIPVAKHGNGSATSVSGASNVLEYLGARFTNDTSQLQYALETAGFTYFHAPLFALGMKHVAPVRKQLGVSTFFNLLGPLVHPAQPQQQLLGVASLAQLRLYKQVHEQLGYNFGIVYSHDGYDEISLTGDFRILRPSLEAVYSPEQAGFVTIHPDSIHGGKSIAEAAEIFMAVLEGRATIAQTEVVLANAAFAVQIATNSPLSECVRKVCDSLDSGAALRALQSYLKVFS